jgi:hypothetical protein
VRLRLSLKINEVVKDCLVAYDNRVYRKLLI